MIYRLMQHIHKETDCRAYTAPGPAAIAGTSAMLRRARAAGSSVCRSGRQASSRAAGRPGHSICACRFGGAARRGAGYGHDAFQSALTPSWYRSRQPRRWRGWYWRRRCWQLSIGWVEELKWRTPCLLKMSKFPCRCPLGCARGRGMKYSALTSNKEKSIQ